MSTTPRRTLESCKKEAKRWREALRTGVPDAWARLRAVRPDAPNEPTLRDVQLALAREHGFAGWTALKQAIQAAENTSTGVHILALYDEKAAALLDAYRTGTPEAMERHYRHTWHRRAWRAMRTYVQLDLGKRPQDGQEDLEITLDDARQLVAREHGFSSWSDLRGFAASIRPGLTIFAKPMQLIVPSNGGDWEPVAGSRNWDELLDLLAVHPSAGLSAERQMTDLLLTDLARVDQLTALVLAGCAEVTDEGIGHLANVPALEYLDLSSTGVTDAGLDVLRHLPRLRTLVLASDRVTDAGLAKLAHCEALEELEVWVPQGGGAALRALRGKRHLRRLELALSDDDIPALHELPAFRTWQGGEPAFNVFGPERAPNHLRLRGRLTDRGLQQLCGLDGLFSLDIDDGRLPLSAAGMKPLASFPRLAALRVDARDDWMPAIAAIPNLRYLGIQDTVAGDDGFAALSRSGSIEYIWGGDCHNLGARGFRALSSMPALRGLSVSCRNVGEEGIALLPLFPSLRELMPMGIADAGYRHIGRCVELERLILMYCRETGDAATEQITGLSRLAYYFASYTLITDRTPELLSGMDSLERITFDTCHGLTDAGVATLARLPRLRELRVSGRGITTRLRDSFPSSVGVFFEG